MSLIADVFVDAENPDKSIIRSHFAALEVVNVRHPSYGESSSGAYDGGAVGDGVTDDITAIRAALTAASGAFAFFPKPDQHYAVSEGIIRDTDSGDYSLIWQDADLRLSQSAASTPTNSNTRKVNSMIWATSSITTFRLYGRGYVKGNYDGVSTGQATGVGCNLDTVGGEIAVHGLFEAEAFTDYGWRFETVTGTQTGTLVGTGNRFQGIAIPNCAEGLSLDQLIGDGNGQNGVDPEWSTGAVGLKGLRIGAALGKNNGTRALSCTTGTASGTDISNQSLDADDFAVSIDVIHGHSNGTASDVVLIRFPNFAANLIDAQGATGTNGRGFHLNNPNDVPQNRVFVRDIVAIGNDYNIYLTGSTTERLKGLFLPSITSRDAATQGMFVAASYWCERAVIGDRGAVFSGNASNTNLTLPTFNNRIELGAGFWNILGFNLYGRQPRTFRLPLTADGSNVDFYIPPGGRLLSVEVNITTADANASAELTLSVGNDTKYTFAADTTGYRRVGINDADIMEGSPGGDAEVEKLGVNDVGTSTTGTRVRLAGASYTGGTLVGYAYFTVEM